jgi:hypothetical protein
MKDDRENREPSPRGTLGLSSPGGLAVLENEISGLREENARLERRLEEARRRAELRVAADRILAIPLQEETRYGS